MSQTASFKPMLLLCAGFPRSGSTWLFNVMRIALQQACVQAYAAWIHDYDASNQAPVHLVKVHDACPLLEQAAAVFVSSRDLRDTVASLRLRQWIEDDPAAIVDYLHLRLHHHGQFERRAHYHVVYEQLEANKPAHIGDVLKALGIDGDPQRIHRQVEQLAMADISPDGRYDRSNLLLVDHIQHGGSGYYREALSPASILAIERHFAAWLSDHGYPVDSMRTILSAPSDPITASTHS